MIEINEFRIGNSLLVANKHHSLCSINLIDFDNSIYDVGYMSEKGVCYLHSNNNYLQPVPLTQEVLMSCGFKFEPYFKLWQKLKGIHGTGTDMEITIDFTVLDFSHRPISKEVKHLHHLQNLFYALNRTELTLDSIIQQNILTTKAEEV